MQDDAEDAHSVRTQYSLARRTRRATVRHR